MVVFQDIVFIALHLTLPSTHAFFTHHPPFHGVSHRSSSRSNFAVHKQRKIGSFFGHENSGRSSSSAAGRMILSVTSQSPESTSGVPPVTTTTTDGAAHALGGVTAATTTTAADTTKITVEPAATTGTTTKLRQLKDRMWVRETLEDLTSAEFASTLVLTPKNEKRKRAVDFEALLQKLDRRIQEMCVVFGGSADDVEECVLQSGGMSSVVYTDEQRDSLLRRILSTRENLMKAMEGPVPTVAVVAPESQEDKAEDLDEIRSVLQEKILPPEESSDSSGLFPKLYVRDDGSVDWDGALQDREALKLFGTSVWARINGLDPDTVKDEDTTDGDSTKTAVDNSHGATDKQKVVATIVETEELRSMKETLDTQTKELKDFETQHTALLNSAINPTNPNAIVNLATLSASLREQIKVSTDILSQKRDSLTFITLNYELERIFTYLEAELGNTFSKGYIPLQDRLAVAEFGLLESQISALQIQDVDSDVLRVIMDQLTDFKRRLGIDYYVNVNPTWDGETARRWSKDLLEKSKEGFEFYVKGCKLFWNDIVFCGSLLQRAVQGYTLKPREVRTLRRTIRDFFTFIPFVIILIIPLSPVGHVLVFGAIQRFFPDFFPSMFTERRQNLLQLYENAEYSEITLNENLKEKALRFSEAIVLLTLNGLRNLYSKITGAEEAVEEANGSADESSSSSSSGGGNASGD